MRPTVALLGGRSAWKGEKTNKLDLCVKFNLTAVFLLGPYFVSFPNLKDALKNRVPIQTDARACTILPNFVGCVARHSFA